MANQTSATEKSPLLPRFPVGFASREPNDEYATDREPHTRELTFLERLRSDLVAELKDTKCIEAQRLLRGQIEVVNLEIGLAEDAERAALVPKHFENQLMGSKLLFMSPLFAVGHSGAKRPMTELPLGCFEGLEYRYEGPALGQDDARTFLGVVHVAKDFRPNTQVFFSVREFCAAIGLEYSGTARKHLIESIKRLQAGFLCGKSMRVQLIGRFEFPSSGPWSVTMDRDVLKLYSGRSHVWLNRNVRASLRLGLETWLYAYIRAHFKLSPTRIETLRKLCGSTAKEKSFRDSLRIALRNLAAAGIIDHGFGYDDVGRVRWMKGPMCDR